MIYDFVIVNTIRITENSCLKGAVVLMLCNLAYKLLNLLNLILKKMYMISCIFTIYIYFVAINMSLLFNANKIYVMLCYVMFSKLMQSIKTYYIFNFPNIYIQ